MSEAQDLTIRQPKFAEGTIADLVDVKRVTEAFGKQLGHRPFKKYELMAAIFDEVGETIHKVKFYWAWWKKPDGPVELRMEDRKELAEELSDIMHFYFLGLYVDSVDFPWLTSSYDLTVTLRGLGAVIEEEKDLHSEQTIYVDLMKIPTLGYQYPNMFLRSIGHFAQLFGITFEEVIDAYYEKAHENIKRWTAVATQ